MRSQQRRARSNRAHRRRIRELFDRRRVRVERPPSPCARSPRLPRTGRSRTGSTSSGTPALIASVTLLLPPWVTAQPRAARAGAPAAGSRARASRSGRAPELGDRASTRSRSPPAARARESASRDTREHVGAHREEAAEAHVDDGLVAGEPLARPRRRLARRERPSRGSVRRQRASAPSASSPG